MMNFECLLYGIKGLLYGLPVSFLVTYAIYHSIDMGWRSNFFIPWESVFVAIISVFVVVFDCGFLCFDFMTTFNFDSNAILALARETLDIEIAALRDMAGRLDQ